MCRVVLLLASLWAGSVTSIAGPCLPGLLSTYLGGTCTAHGIDFSAWGYAAGGTAIGADEILVTPSVVNPVFEFHVITPGGWVAGIGEIRTPSISMTATNSLHAFGSLLFLAFATGAGTSSVVGELKECLGDLFAGGCAGTTTSLFVGAPGGPIIDTNSFGPHDPIDLQLLMTINGGDAFARIETINAGLFVPEPSVAIIVAAALLALMFARRAAVLRRAAPLNRDTLPV